MNMLKYSNGWGHVIMSVVLCATGVALLFVPSLDATSKGVGVGLITTVAGYWFVSSSAQIAAKDTADQMSQKMTQDTADQVASKVITATVPAVVAAAAAPNTTTPEVPPHAS